MDIRTGRIALRFATIVNAAALENVAHLRGQAVFMMGAGGSGKGFAGRRWMKYMPGAPSTGLDYTSPKHKEFLERKLSEEERGLTNINFEKAKEDLEKRGIKLKTIGKDKASIKFELFEYDNKGTEVLIPEKHWKEKLPVTTYNEVKGLKEVIFAAPVHEIPSFWRQVDPDLYKQELAGYMETEPGYVHEMSSTMSKAYFSAILESGDPLFVDGTGSNFDKMRDIILTAKSYGYSTSLVFVYVPLTVNHIRNATRERNVNPNIITRQWSQIADVYAGLKSLVKVAKVIVLRNDKGDAAKYKRHSQAINESIAKYTEHSNLYELIKREAPNELTEWGRLLQTGNLHDPKRVERFDRLEQKRKERGLAPREFVANNKTLSSSLRSECNSILRRKGFDGNGRFKSTGQALSEAFTVLGKMGIEMDAIVSSHTLKRPSGITTVDLAFINEEDSFSPIPISNSVLSFSWAELRKDTFEVIAYLS